jgi:hypothetical protein
MTLIDRLTSTATRFFILGPAPADERPLVFHQLTARLRTLQKDTPWWKPFHSWMEDPTSRKWVEYWTSRVFDHFNPSPDIRGAIDRFDRQTGQPLPTPSRADVVESVGIQARKKALLDRIDRFMVGRRGLDAIELDRAFLRSAAAAGFFSRPWGVETFQTGGNDETHNVAFAALMPHRQGVFMANVPGGRMAPIGKGGDLSLNRWFTVAHEAAHCELESRPVMFVHPDIPKAQSDAINRQFFNTPVTTPLRSVLHEMVADAMAAVTIGRMSGFDPALAPEFSRIIRERREGADVADRHLADRQKKNGESPSVLEAFQNNPHRTAGIMESVLEKANEWRHLPPQALFDWAQKEASRHWLSTVVACGPGLHGELGKLMETNNTEGLWNGASNILGALVEARIENAPTFGVGQIMGDYAHMPLGLFFMENETHLNHLLDTVRTTHAKDWAVLCQIQASPMPGDASKAEVQLRHQARCNIAEHILPLLLEQAGLPRRRSSMDVMGELQRQTKRLGDEVLDIFRQEDVRLNGPSKEVFSGRLDRTRTLAELQPARQAALSR